MGKNEVFCFFFSSVDEPEEDICNPDDIDSCEFGGMCIVNSEGKPDCQCEDTCSLRINPVCGSDGESYENECYLQLEVCRRRSAINVLHAGECGKPSSVVTKPLNILNYRICMKINYTRVVREEATKVQLTFVLCHKRRSFQVLYHI